jgi:preprotein translocase subunit SecE
MAEVAKLKHRESTNEGSPIGMQGTFGKIAEYPKRIAKYVHDVRVEMSKVNWPSRDDVVSTTVVVVITVGLFAAYFAAIDTGLSYLVNRLFKLFKV